MVFNPNQIIWTIIWINELDYSYLIHLNTKLIKAPFWVWAKTIHFETWWFWPMTHCKLTLPKTKLILTPKVRPSCGLPAATCSYLDSQWLVMNGWLNSPRYFLLYTFIYTTVGGFNNLAKKKCKSIWPTFHSWGIKQTLKPPTSDYMRRHCL